MTAILLVLALAGGSAAYFLRNGWMHGVTTRLPKQVTACPTVARVLVIAGQSLAANAGQIRTGTEIGKGYAFDGQNCYALLDPVAGGEGGGGSIWPAVVNRLPGPTIVISGAVVGSSILDWTDRDGHHSGYRDRLLGRVERLSALGRFSPTIVYMQGETDAGSRMSAKGYLTELRTLKAKLAPDRPWLVVRESRCFLGDKGWPALDQARFAFAKSDRTVVIGPTLDDLGDGYRRDDRCHLTGHGQEEVARRVATALQQVSH